MTLEFINEPMAFSKSRFCGSGFGSVIYCGAVCILHGVPNIKVIPGAGAEPKPRFGENYIIKRKNSHVSFYGGNY